MAVSLLRILLAGLLVLVLGALTTSCKEDDTAALERARELAFSFHNAMMKRDVDALVRLVDYPFNFDLEEKARNEAEFRKILGKRWSEMERKMRSAVQTEQVTYHAFIDGAAIDGQSFDDADEAERQAKKVDLREGGVLVCCYHVDKETNRRDARKYFLVMQPNELGDLKVITYHD